MANVMSALARAADEDMLRQVAILEVVTIRNIVGTEGMKAVDKAAGLVNLLKPQAVIPFHYGSVAGSPKDFDRFAALVDPAIRVCRKV